LASDSQPSTIRGFAARISRYSWIASAARPARSTPSARLSASNAPMRSLGSGSAAGADAGGAPDDARYPSDFRRARTSAGTASGSFSFAPSVVRAIQPAIALAVCARDAASSGAHPGRSRDRTARKGRLDEPEVLFGGGREIAPAEVQPRIEGFGVHAAIDPRVRRERGSDALAIERTGVEASQIEQGRRDIHEAQRTGDVSSGTAARQPQDPRHLQRFTVQQDPVLGLAVIAEPFAVVGHDRDDGAVEPATRLDPIEQPPDEFVGIRNLAIVGVAGAIGRRG
jgi:hypothetical protein